MFFFLNSCSIACFKEHKKSCQENAESKNCDQDGGLTETTAKYNFPTEDTVPIEKLEELRQSRKVTNSLKDPQLRDIITSVLKDKNPTKALANAMMNPLFTEFANACLEVTAPPDEEKPC